MWKLFETMPTLHEQQPATDGKVDPDLREEDGDLGARFRREKTLMQHQKRVQKQANVAHADKAADESPKVGVS